MKSQFALARSCSFVVLTFAVMILIGCNKSKNSPVAVAETSPVAPVAVPPPSITNSSTNTSSPTASIPAAPIPIAPSPSTPNVGTSTTPGNLGTTASTVSAGKTKEKPTPPIYPDSPVPLDTPLPPPGPVDPTLYGPSIGEDIAKKKNVLKSSPLRCRKTDTLYKLSNLKSEVVKAAPNAKGMPGKDTPVISVDYDVVSEGTLDSDVTVVLRTADGHEATVNIKKMEKRGGTISLKTADTPFWIGGGIIHQPKAGGPLPQNLELYLVRNDTRFGKDLTRSFKVSNSLLLGKTRFPISLARDWTPLEGAIFAIETPKPGLNPGAGELTSYAGTSSPFPARYAYPDKMMVGVDVSVGGWDNENCLSNLVPIYERNYPEVGMMRLMAKNGYAVGAITVKTNKYVDAIKITFMKIKADNSGLDPMICYTSGWLGPQQSGNKEVRLGGDGRKVIGVACVKGAILDGLALVMDQEH